MAINYGSAMVMCGRCGTNLTGSDRCARCDGSPIPAFEVLGTTRSATSEVSHRGSSGPSRPVIGLGLFVLAAVMWAVVGGGENDSDDRSGGEVVQDREDGPISDDRGTGAEEPRPTNSDESTDTTTVPGRLFGVDTGLVAIVSGRPLVRVVDLDTGRELEVALRGNPIAVVGDRLVLSDDAERRVTSVPLDNLEAEPTVLGQGFFLDSDVAASPDGETIRLPTDPDRPTSWNLVDAVTGEVDRSLDIAPEILAGLVSHPVGGPSGLDLMSPRTGGIYRLGIDGYEFVRSGMLSAVSGPYALVAECTSQLRCSLTRHRWSDWTPDVDPLGTDDIREVIAEGRAAVLFSSDGNEYLDLDRGDPVASWSQGQLFDWFASSFDGRFVATRNAGRVEIIDLDTDETVTLSISGETVVLANRNVVLGLIAATP